MDVLLCGDTSREVHNGVGNMWLIWTRRFILDVLLCGDTSGEVCMFCAHAWGCYERRGS